MLRLARRSQRFKTHRLSLIAFLVAVSVLIASVLFFGFRIAPIDIAPTVAVGIGMITLSNAPLTNWIRKWAAVAGETTDTIIVVLLWFYNFIQKLVSRVFSTIRRIGGIPLKARLPKR